jgi:hypothetical protein
MPLPGPGTRIHPARMSRSVLRPSPACGFEMTARPPPRQSPNDPRRGGAQRSSRLSVRHAAVSCAAGGEATSKPANPAGAAYALPTALLDRVKQRRCQFSAPASQSATTSPRRQPRDQHEHRGALRRGREIRILWGRHPAPSQVRSSSERAERRGARSTSSPPVASTWLRVASALSLQRKRMSCYRFGNGSVRSGSGISRYSDVASGSSSWMMLPSGSIASHRR